MDRSGWGELCAAPEPASREHSTGQSDRRMARPAPLLAGRDTSASRAVHRLAATGRIEGSILAMPPVAIDGGTLPGTRTCFRGHRASERTNGGVGTAAR